MDQILLSLFVLAGVVTAVGAYRAIQRYLNEVEAWRYRKDLAITAHLIESDPTAPEDLKAAVGFLADSAFDREFFRNIQTMPLPLTDSRKPTSRKKWQERYGPEYGAALYEALHNLTMITMLCDSKAGWMMRHFSRTEWDKDSANCDPRNKDRMAMEEARAVSARQGLVEQRYLDDHGMAA